MVELSVPKMGDLDSGEEVVKDDCVEADEVVIVVKVVDDDDGPDGPNVIDGKNDNVGTGIT